jgi:hypothetical protein
MTGVKIVIAMGLAFLAIPAYDISPSVTIILLNGIIAALIATGAQEDLVNFGRMMKKLLKK